MTRKLFLLIWRLLVALLGMSAEALRFVRVVFRSQARLVGENLFLRKQLTFYQERNNKPRRLTDFARFALLFWSRWFPWRSALGGETGDSDRLAPVGLPAFLAVEVTTGATEVA